MNTAADQKRKAVIAHQEDVTVTDAHVIKPPDLVPQSVGTVLGLAKMDFDENRTRFELPSEF